MQNSLSGIAMLSVLLAAGSASATTVFSNSAGGDAFTNPTNITSNILAPGAAIGSTGWFYTNVRNNGIVGIDADLPRSGNGSARLRSTQGPGGLSSKADIEYLHQAAPGGTFAMGTLGSLNSLAFDWYKKGSSAATQHAALRMYIDADGSATTTNDRGYLVFERAYNGAMIPTDTWVTDNLFGYNAGAGANLWQVAFGLGNFDTAGNWQPISTWASPAGFTPSPNGRTFNASSVVFGLSIGVGGGWNTYDGAIDNVSIGFTGGQQYNFNFEVIPTPGAAALLGLAGLAGVRRRR